MKRLHRLQRRIRSARRRVAAVLGYLLRRVDARDVLGVGGFLVLVVSLWEVDPRLGGSIAGVLMMAAALSKGRT